MLRKWGQYQGEAGFLNHVHADHRPAHALGLKIVSMQMSVCVCVPTTKAITN